MNTYSDSCSGSYASGLCPGSSNIKCCQTGQTGGLTYPVVGHSSEPSFDNGHGFGDQRIVERKICSVGYRCHAGCDLQQGTAQAIADGEVTHVGYNFTECNLGMTNAVLVYHPSLDVTVNYGEINSNAMYVSKGNKVSKGQPLGSATNCKMLHFEVYSGKRASSIQWCPPGYLGSGETCATKYPQTKPAALMNCEDFLSQHF
jgi:murein DD-endopeptidase MepM/ murein hydrolase activator NlpD